ncbi:LOW QUALITY PROTEIN: nascent polypeptide-associated complex subunit alpha, muscle-specific form-like [Portunus trituberculatus]|nr:LOW QUALITY PROTEIN: nascent polypeptide-associated complex subunit alpha, muscle-specific form-like [Portunus trituberculatus]
MRTFGGSVTHVPKTVAMTIQVSTTGGAVLNPEATVFQLPPTPRSPTHSTPTPAHASATPAPAPTPTPTPAHINGFHSNVDPFMNGDVGLECCGVDCPATPEDCPASVGALGGATPLQGDAPPKAAPAKALSGATEAAPLQTPSAAPPQQNGEVTAGVAGQGTASPAPTPPAAPQSPTPPSPAPMEAGQAGQGGQGEGLAPGSETQATQTTPTQTPSPASPPGSPPGTPAATPAPGQMAPPPPPQQPLSREQIKQLVAQQVEYFFSRENLSSDPYLISQMDSDQYVPVYILANCTQFKTITKDHSIIVEALKESPFVQLDEERNRVRPNYKRCIVILREIPESTPIEEIESVFKSDECPKVVSCEFVHNSSWYVTFESDEDAQKAYWYLRGVVKTFKDKPILARIKTKPISRLGCLSVLPSYGGKAGGGTEAKEAGSGTAPPSAQPSPSGATGGARSGAGTQAAAGNYGSSGGRFLFSTHQSVNPGSYTYTYTPASSPMPTAYFYPNVMQWTPPPGGFYDINSFLQFNGLSPQGTFTPHNPGPTLRYPPNRRNPKHRDNNRYDKDSRHNTTTTATTTPNQTPHYQRQHHHHHHRPHPTPSPSQPQPQHQQHRPPSRAPPSAAPTPPPPPPPNMESFAQNDISLASQSGLYTSFSPPATVEKEVVTVSTTNTTSTPLGKISTPSTSPTHSPPPVLDEEQMQPPPPPPQPPQPPLPPPPHLHQPPHMHPRHHHHHHHHHHQFPPPHHLAQGLPGPPPPPPPHRHGTYPPDHFHHHHHPPHLHQQGPRPVPRNPRRRPRGREEEMLAGPGRGGPPQRTTGAPHQPPGSVAGDVGKQATPTPQEGSPAPPPPPPQFDLEAASFPPLPSTDEPAVVVVERRSNDPLPSAWGETQPQRFSDIMKGNPKPRPPSITDTPTDTPPTPTSATATQTPPTTTVTPTAPATAPTTATAATTPSQTPTTTTTTTTPPPSTTIDDHNHHHQTTTTTTTATTPATAPAPTPATAPPPAPAPKQDPRPARDQRLERRPVGAGAGATPNGATNGPRERREFPREYPQRGQAGREFRGNRDPTLRAGKENRPIRSREDRMDADGWITKGSRESRAQRETREQWERGESSSSAPRHHYNNNNNNNHHYHHNHHLVNGDSASPPPSPKPQKGESKLGDDCTDAAKGVSGRPLNNNDGEHKTTWAKMALASKDHMERLAAELKEKEEQEKIKKQRLATRPPPRPQEKVVAPRERDGKMVRRDALPREPRGLPGERGGPIPFRPRDAATPKSPK